MLAADVLLLQGDWPPWLPVWPLWSVDKCLLSTCVRSLAAVHRLPLLPVYMHTPELFRAALVSWVAIVGTNLPV